MTVLLLAGIAGCARGYEPGLRRIGFDWNSLGAPSAHWERRDHLPYRRAQVDYFRWMYHAPPQVGLPMPEAAAPLAEDDVPLQLEPDPGMPPSEIPLQPVPPASPPPADPDKPADQAETQSSAGGSGEFRLLLDRGPEDRAGG